MWTQIARGSHTAIALACAIVLTGCGGSSGSSAPGAGLGSDPPLTANAGTNQVVDEGTTVQLQGAGNDADGPVTFDWIQIIGPPVALSDSTIANPSFVVPNVPIGAREPIVLRLTVTDSADNFAVDDITITIDSNDFIVFIARGDRDDDFKSDELFKYETKTGTYLSLTGPLAAQFQSADIQTVAVSPDGNLVAYEFDYADGTVLNIVQSDSFGTVKITEISNPPAYPNDQIVDIRWASDGSRFAYQATGANQVTDIYSVRADGTGNIKISTAITSVRLTSRWAWAADSSRLAYLADPGGTGSAQLYTARPDGADVQQVSAAGAEVESWAWAPDGASLAYAAKDGKGPLELYTVRPDGSNLAYISAGAGLYRERDWSWAPDSSRIAYAPDNNGLVALNISLADGSDHTELCGPAVSGSNCHGATWSLDGSRVAFIGDGLNISNPDGQDWVNVPSVLPQHMQWSPDGSLVAYDGTQGISEVSEIFVVTSNGAANTRISGPIFDGGNATLSIDAWAPDASRIKYSVTERDGLVTHEVWTSTPDGALSDRILRGEDMFRSFSGIQAGYWSQDGSRILYAARTSSRYVLPIATPNGTIETTIFAPNGDSVRVADPEIGIDYSEPAWWP